MHAPNHTTQSSLNHLLHSSSHRFQFLVHPEGFLVHRAHPRAPASQAYVTKEAGKASVLRRNVTR
jgi:hypothetical protein